MDTLRRREVELVDARVEVAGDRLNDRGVVGESDGGVESLESDGERGEPSVVARGEDVAAPGVANGDGGGDTVILSYPVLGDGVLVKVGSHDVAGILGLGETKKEREKGSFGVRKGQCRGWTKKRVPTEIPRTWRGEPGELMEPVRDMLGVGEAETALLSEKTPASSSQTAI